MYKFIVLLSLCALQALAQHTITFKEGSTQPVNLYYFESEKVYYSLRSDTLNLVTEIPISEFKSIMINGKSYTSYSYYSNWSDIKKLNNGLAKPMVKASAETLPINDNVLQQKQTIKLNATIPEINLYMLEGGKLIEKGGGQMLDSYKFYGLASVTMLISFFIASNNLNSVGTIVSTGAVVSSGLCLTGFAYNLSGISNIKKGGRRLQGKPIY